MSTLYATAAPGETHRAFRPPQWLREPLLHFAVLGAVLFAADYALVGRTEDPRTHRHRRRGGRGRSARVRRGARPGTERRGALRAAASLARQRGAVSRRPRAATRQRRRRHSRARDLQGAQRRSTRASRGRRSTTQRCARGSRRIERVTTSRRATTSRRPCCHGGAGETRFARLRCGPERRHARRRPSGLTRVQGPATREPGAKLRRGVHRGARVGRGRCWRALQSTEGLRAVRLLAVDATATGRRSRRCTASCCRIGRMPSWPSSAVPQWRVLAKKYTIKVEEAPSDADVLYALAAVALLATGARCALTR